MKEIDLRPGTRDFRVSTVDLSGPAAHMGPNVLVKARDSDHAKEIVKQAGHSPNPYFPPEEIRKD
jgi:hypothetical protein